MRHENYSSIVVYEMQYLVNILPGGLFYCIGVTISDAHAAMAMNERD